MKQASDLREFTTRNKFKVVKPINRRGPRLRHLTMIAFGAVILALIYPIVPYYNVLREKADKYDAIQLSLSEMTRVMPIVRTK